MEKKFHKPVLTEQVIQYLNIKQNKTYLDATFGGGGHSKAILQKEPTCKVIALDWDQKTLEKQKSEFINQFGNRIKILWGNFANLHRIFKKEKIENVDGILVDFGTSQYQIENIPGMSFQKKLPLDMRISQAHQKITAADILNKFSEKELSKIFFELGEEKKSRQIAKKIIEFRKKEKFKNTSQLKNLIENIIPKHQMLHRKHFIHPATKIFQALRIYVNKELENIKKFLPQAIEVLNTNGRIVCISFHSLEDRIVKTFFRENKNQLKILTPKPITASKAEIQKNPSARTAKLRAAEKT
ncbi:16S rRNA (cytosine(1402)-N(4))-methyltransferase RsmH [Candidatus Dependentiae bacterium]|nr:16S rRNA (cytosine(1402)-N(4))-methyltransferase RsmH [Candidatus Dependentiae bacterium]